MACSSETPLQPPHLHPFRCSQHTAWPVGGTQHVVVDGGEVLHIGFGFQHAHGIYTHRGIAVALAEALAIRLTPKAAA